MVNESPDDEESCEEEEPETRSTLLASIRKDYTPGHEAIVEEFLNDQS